jgi:ATP-binding protein involved in chromosome partitioning
MAVAKTQVLDELRRIKGPALEGNIVDLGLVSEILIRDGRVYFSITVPPEAANELEPLRQAAEKVVSEIAGVKGVTAVLTADAPKGQSAPRTAADPGRSAEHARVAEARARGATGDGAAARAPQRGAAPVPGVKHLIAVGSGKGGVGKSTTALNLALGFQAMGLKAGILDADIYGPSQPKLLGLSGNPQTRDNKLVPMKGYGLDVMSMGFMIDEATPVVWRGPMIVQALNQMLRDVAWSGLDVLVIDMPPGTGDVQLTLSQQVPLDGAIIVSTPQDLALLDARKGLEMFRKTNVPLIGIIENMSYFLCPKCGERSEIFGHGGAETEAQRLDIPFLGAIPLHMDIRTRSDSGKPITATDPGSIHAQIFRDIAVRAWEAVQGSRGGIVTPELTLSPARDALTVAYPGGATHLLTAEMLRVMSPSAEVQGHSPEQRVTVARKKNVKIKDLAAVGNYAVKIVFDDGHDTGLYAWNYLDELGREKDARWAWYLAELSQKGLNRE